MIEGKIRRFGDDEFEVSLDADPVMLTVDAMTSRPGYIKARISGSDMRAIQGQEDAIMAEFSSKLFHNCGFCTSDQLADLVEEIFVTTCRTGSGEDAVLNACTCTPFVVEKDKRYTLSLRAKAIKGSSKHLKIVWKAKRVVLPDTEASGKATREAMHAALAETEAKIKALQTSDDAIDTVAWLEEHNINI